MSIEQVKIEHRLDFVPDGETSSQRAGEEMCHRT